MSARDWIEFDGKPGTSTTDVVTFVIVLFIVLATLALVALIIGETIAR